MSVCHNAVWALTVFSSVLVLGMGEGAIAQPVPDRSTNTNIAPNGSGFDIDGGDRAGRNLFHSFDEFSVDNGSPVRFLRGNEFDNIINRVTGDATSNIDDLLSVDGGANLFLLNPNGIIFGENARLDLRGSFIASTADEIKFGNRGSFSADNLDPPATNLRIAPDALVFNQLNNRPDIAQREIRVEAPVDSNPDGLRVRGGRSLFFAGGPVNIQGGILQAPQGRIEIAALGDEAELPIASNNGENRFLIDRNSDDFPNDATAADITLARQALIDVTGSNRGDITFYGRNIDIRNLSNICAGIGPASTCSRIQDSESGAFDDLEAFGNENSRAGNIVLFATDTVSLGSGSQIINRIYPNSTAQSEDDSRDAFNDLLQVFSRQNLVDFDELFGSIIVSANAIALDGTQESLTIEDRNEPLNVRTQINAGTAGLGNAGLIFLAATDVIDIVGIPVENVSDSRLAQITSSVESNAVGNAGGIFISARELNLTSSATIIASTFSEGRPGNIDIFADNPATEVENDGAVNLSDISLITSNVENGGNGGALASQDDLRETDIANSVELRGSDEGAISIRAGTVRLSNVSQIQTLVRDGDAENAGRGDAGTIFIIAGDLLIEGAQTEIDAEGNVDIFSSGLFSSVGTNATGDGGLIFVIAGNVNVNDGGRINVTTSGSAGLTVDANGREREVDVSTGGSAFVFALGDIGVQRGSSITASAAGNNEAGNIFLLGGRYQVVRSGSSIEASTESGNGGNIFTFTNNLFLVEGSNLRTNAGDGGGTDSEGGNIGIGANIVVGYPSNDSNIDARAPEGRGGRITIDFTNLQDITENSDDFPLTNDVTATGGVEDGIVTINEFDVDPVRGVFELPELVVDVESLLVQDCPGPGQNAADQLGALYVTGQGGIPPSIGDRPTTDEIFAEWVTGPDTTSDESTEADFPDGVETASPDLRENSDVAVPAVEAQQLVADANGELWLVADVTAPAVPSPSPRCAVVR